MTTPPLPNSDVVKYETRQQEVPTKIKVNNQTKRKRTGPDRTKLKGKTKERGKGRHGNRRGGEGGFKSSIKYYTVDRSDFVQS